MAIRKDTIKAQVLRVQNAFPNLNEDTSQRYKHGNEQRGRWEEITLWSLFVSDEGTFLFRPHVFRHKPALTAAEWKDWLDENFGKILPRVLDGMEARTDKQWRVYRTMGYTKNDTSQLKSRQPRSRGNKKSNKRK